MNNQVSTITVKCLGQVALANGYTLGGPIAVGTAIPTVTRQPVGYFIGVSFGSRP